MRGLTRRLQRPKTALVLGAGGIKSVCHLGLFRVLQRHNIPVDLVVGSSGGGLFGASYALGVPAGQIEAWVDRYWKQEIFQDYGYRQMLKMLSPRRLKFDENFGIIKGEQVRRVFQKLFGELTFDDTHIPLHVVASDLQAGEAVVINDGALVEAIRASISMPVFFQPHVMNGRYLVDGALCAPLPLEFAIAEGAEVIISMGFANRPHERIDSPLRLVSQLMKISGTALQRATMAYYARHPSIEIVPIELELDSALGMRDVGEIPRLIDLGEEVAETMLPAIQGTIETFHSPVNRLKRRVRYVARRWLRTSILDLPRLSVCNTTDPTLVGNGIPGPRPGAADPANGASDQASDDAAAEAQRDPFPA